MSRVSNKLAKPTEKTKLIKELQITEQDIEFILLAIKQSMIPGASLEQAVNTIEKLQNIYKKLKNAGHTTDSFKGVGAIRKAQARKQAEEDQKLEE